jgi:signal transduction histidine kinase
LAGLGTLTAGVAHELVTPISIITNTCSNMQAEIEDDDLSQENLLRYIQIIEQSIWRCNRIVSVLRNYSFAEEQLMTVTDLSAIVEDALTLVRHQFRGEFQIEVDVIWEQESKSIVCDHNRITQMLINLLINARDAMQPNGGTIRIKSWSLSSLEYSPPPSDAAYANGHSAIVAHALTVEDTGHGIDPAIMDKIFDPFFTTKPSGQGTGLGLFLARRIVNQHNGRIWAENNAHDGATFTIILPRRQ